MENRSGLNAEKLSDFGADTRLAGQYPVQNSRLKRAMDLALVLPLVLFLAPLLATIFLLLKLLQPGPALFRHERIGRNGQPFMVYKFRTMRIDAAQRLEQLLARDPMAAAEWQTYHKLRRDPRITGLGQLLRRSSLDELPQLLNVLRGEMSVIGPRPVTASEMQRYGASRPFYMLVKPGIVGLWQVRGRNTLAYSTRVALDVEYVQTWSLIKDISILFQAVPVVLLARGAF